MYYFSYKNIQYGNFSYRSFSLYHEGKSSISSKSSVTVNAKIKVYDKSLMGAMSSLVCSTRLRGRHRGSVNIRVASDLTVNNKVLVLSKASIKGKAAMPVNAVLKHNIKLTMASKANCIASAKTVERLKGRATLSANSSLISNELLKHYGQCSLKSKAAIVSDSRVPVYARAVIKSNTNADVNSKVVTRLYGDADFKSYTGVTIFSLLNLYSASSAIQSNITFTINSLLKHYEQCHLSTNVSIATNSKVYTRQRASIQIKGQANTTINSVIRIYANTGISNYFSYANIDYGNFCYTPYNQYYNIVGRSKVDCSSVLRVYANATILTAGASLNGNSKILLMASSQIRVTTGLIANAKWIFIKHSDGIIKAIAETSIDSEVYTRIKASGSIQCSSLLGVDSFCKHYVQSTMSSSATVSSSEILKAFTGAMISGHGYATTGGVIRLFEEAAIASMCSVHCNGALRWKTSASLEACSPGLEVREIVKEYANVIIESGINITANVQRILLTNLSNAPIMFFDFGKRCYFLDGNDYYYYDGTTAGKVTDIAYVPTIAQGKNPDGTGGYAHEELNILSNSWKEEFAGTVDDTDYVLTIEADSVVCWKDGVLIDPADYTFPAGETDYRKVVFNVAPGEVIITIQGTKDKLNDPSDITQCTIAQEWGGKNDTRVFFTGNPDISNRRWRCGLFDPTYFPLSGWDDIGSDAEANKGLGRLLDYQVIFKESTMYYSSVEGPDSQGNVSFPSLPMNEEYGCMAPRTIQPAQGGLLALAKEGVTFAVPSFVRGQLNVRMISEKINSGQLWGRGINDFTLDEREAAHAYISDQKYYLHIKDMVWVLDLRYSNLPQGQYCWYPFTGIPGKAMCYLEKDELLYVGDQAKEVVYKQYTPKDDLRFRDDNTAIDAWWTSPMIFGYRNWIKFFRQLNITFGGQVIASHSLTFITDDWTEDIEMVFQDTRAFDYGEIDYGMWTYGCNPYPSTEPEKVGYKGEYLQWKIRNNNIGENLEILAQNLLYSRAKKIK